MIEGTPSQTALMVAGMRAYHYKTAPEPKILRDDLAMALCGYADEAMLTAQFDAMTAQFAALSDQDTAELFVRRIAETVCMRSRLVEGQLEAALERGLSQLVIMGAGLDTTAYRLKELTRDLKIFEVDYPSTQIWKRERLAACHIDVPENVSFVSYDFENQTLPEALKAGGVDPNAMTLFPWLGVQPYLTDEAVRATVKTMASYPEGSEMVMDFVAPRYEDLDDMNADGLDQLQTIVEGMGEPFMSRYLPEDLGALLTDCGFNHVTFPMPGELTDRLLGGVREAYSMPDGAFTMAYARV